jgi:hypothetical protein
LIESESAFAFAWFSDKDGGRQSDAPTIVLSGFGAMTDEQALKKKIDDIYRAI